MGENRTNIPEGITWEIAAQDEGVTGVYARVFIPCAPDEIGRVGQELMALFPFGALPGGARPPMSEEDDSRECTGFAAQWCPVHGTCRCPDREQAMDDEACPLHAPTSRHAENEIKPLANTGAGYAG